MSLCGCFRERRGNWAVLAGPIKSIFLPVGADDLTGIFKDTVSVPVCFGVRALRRNVAAADFDGREFITADNTSADLGLTFDNIPEPASVLVARQRYRKRPLDRAQNQGSAVGACLVAFQLHLLGGQFVKRAQN